MHRWVLQLANAIFELEYFRSPPEKGVEIDQALFVQSFTPNPRLHLECPQAAKVYIDAITASSTVTTELDQYLGDLDEVCTRERGKGMEFGCSLRDGIGSGSWLTHSVAWHVGDLFERQSSCRCQRSRKGS